MSMLFPTPWSGSILVTAIQPGKSSACYDMAEGGRLQLDLVTKRYVPQDRLNEEVLAL